jgi:undecaprenyl-diphosphatase
MQPFHSVDLALLRWLTPWHTPALDAAMSWISSAGGAGTVWLLLGVAAFVLPRHRAAAWRVFLTIALAYLAVDGVMKPLIARERPSIRAYAPPRDLPPLPRSFSFPSGHAASTFGAAVAVSRMWPPTRLVWWSLAILIGYSRIYLGHHYPLDVLGGALLGIGLALWVLGGRHRATYASTLPKPLPPGVVVRP